MNRYLKYLRHRYTQIYRRVYKNRYLGTIVGIKTNEQVCCLTFDDGPDEQDTPRLLDILNSHGARATFFMLGVAARENPAIVERVRKEGHAIGNHTWDHPAVPLIKRRERVSQILATEKTLSLNGNKLFRPPYGFQNLPSRVDAWLMGYDVVGWNIGGYDWLDYSSRRIKEHLEKSIKPGAIILFHDTLFHTLKKEYAPREPLLEALDAFLYEWKNKFRFVTVPELISMGEIIRMGWFKKANREWLNSLSGNHVRKY